MAILPLASTATREWHYIRAEHDFLAGNDVAALDQIREALLISRDDAAFWRLAAQISDRLGSPDAAYCWQQADRLEPGVTETQLALADAALRHDQLDLASAALREVAPEQQGGIACLVRGRPRGAGGGKHRTIQLFLRAGRGVTPERRERVVRVGGLACVPARVAAGTRLAYSRWQHDPL